MGEWNLNFKGSAWTAKASRSRAGMVSPTPPPPEPTDEEASRKDLIEQIGGLLKELDEVEADLKKQNPSGVQH